MSKLFILFIIIFYPGQLIYGQYKPFSGGIQFGLGTSTAIDFRYVENMISYVPFQAGFIVEKDISNTQYLELGILFAKHSSRFLKLIQNNGERPVYTILGADFPINYHFNKWNNSYGSHPYFGLVPVWIVYNSGYHNSGPDVTDESFRNVYLAATSGICINKNHTKIKVQLTLAVTSVIKKDFELNYPCESSKCGGRFYPVELLLCYALLGDK